MRRVIASVFQSLDGVMQAPGGPTEDTTGGFASGGWMFGHSDEGVGEAIGAIFAQPFALLLGRRTYDIFAGYWPYVTGEEAAFAKTLNDADKYVLTRGGADLSWENSHALADLDALAALKQGDGPDLLIQGSSTLYPQLLARGLLDRLTTLTFPVVLGRGKRLFGDDTAPAALSMTDHRVTPTGIVVATYEPAGPVRTGTFALPETSAREQARQDRIAKEDNW